MISTFLKSGDCAGQSNQFRSIHLPRIGVIQRLRNNKRLDGQTTYSHYINPQFGISKDVISVVFIPKLGRNEHDESYWAYRFKKITMT